MTYPLQVLWLFIFFTCKGMLRFSVLSWIDPLLHAKLLSNVEHVDHTRRLGGAQAVVQCCRQAVPKQGQQRHAPRVSWPQAVLLGLVPPERTWRFQSGGMCEKKQKHLLKSCDLHTCHKTDLRMDKRLSISTKSLNPVGTVLVTLSTCTLQTTWTHSAWCLLWCVRHWSGNPCAIHKSISFPKSWIRKLCKKGTKLASPQWAEPVKRPGCVFVVHFTMERRNGP